MTYLVANDEHLSSVDEREARRNDMLLNGVLHSLQDSVVFGEVFTCPILRQCAAKVSRCEQGYDTLAVLPSEGCAARAVSDLYRIVF